MSDQQVFERRHALEQPDVLESARHPRLAGDFVVGHALQQKKFTVGGRRVAAARARDGRDVLRRGDAVARKREFRPSVGL